jgi:hypothetical protein
MTIRKPVSQIHNLFHNAQRVDTQDMDVEQSYNINTNAAIINNHFGSGILPRSITPNILFDSDNLSASQASLLAAGNFDGTGLQVASQPTDTNLGNQIAVQLTNSTVLGRFSVKVLIIGLDFQGTPQYDRFTFHKNETQVTAKHYTRILAIFFNDFKGNHNCSRDLGGTIVISEATSYQLSRDPIMISQDIEPNLFFRDFKVPNAAVTLYNTLQAGMGSVYTVDSLNINTTVKINRVLGSGDVTSKVGEKFLAFTNNIQKISLLLGAEADMVAPIENKFDWAGDLVITVYELQTVVDCPSDIVPELGIEFEPKPQALAQLSFSQNELYDLGYVLTNVLQPVDFVFSNTSLGNTTNPIIVANRYYAVTVNRSGAASSGTILIGSGNNQRENARATLFNGVWVDVPEDDLWFQIWTDAAKVADGQAYDAGNGIDTEKTAFNTLGAEVDYSLQDLNFADSGENILNTAIIAAIEIPSLEEQDERTGAPVFARQKFEPSFSFVTTANLNTLRETSEPLVIGCAKDINAKQNIDLQKSQTLPGLAKGDTFRVVNPDADLLSLNMIGSKLIPNVTCATKDYRIFKVLVCTDGYGDVNGDGVINELDIVRATELLGADLNDLTTQGKILDGYIDTLEVLRADVDGDGVITSNDVNLITQYVSRQINGFPVGSSFTHMEITVQQSVGRNDGYYDCDGYIRLDGYGSQNIISPGSLDPYELLYDGYLTEPSIDGDDPIFTTIPFPGITYQILFQAFWQDYFLLFDSGAREVPAAFTFGENIVINSCIAPTLFECEDRSERDLDCDSGRTDILFPDNIIIGKGEILRPDGNHYSIDYEIGQVILQLPQVPLSESLIDIMGKFIVDAGGGFTEAGFPAMRFADCSTVKADALARHQIKFGVAVQAFAPNLDGYDDDGYGVIVDDIIGVYIDHQHGILTLSIKDLSVDPIYMTLVTKIEITVHLKKAGWKNEVLVIEPDQLVGLLSI